MPERTWPKEPWNVGDDEITVWASDLLRPNDISRIKRGVPQASAKRVVECVNAMRGWSAPEGAVRRLLEDVQGVRDAMAAPYYSKEAAIATLDDRLAEFVPVSEPSGE